MLRVTDRPEARARWSQPVFTGRVVAALAARPDLLARSGQALRVRELATELGVEDVLYGT